MLKNYKDVAEVILGIIIFCIIFVVAEKTSLREKINSNKALLSESALSIEGIIGNSSHDFGVVSMRGGNKSHSFVFKNEGKEDVRFKSAYTSCGCLEIFINNSNKTYGPFNARDYLFEDNVDLIFKKGEKMAIQLVYDPLKQGPFGVGLSEPFAVLEDEFRGKIYLRISVLVFP